MVLDILPTHGVNAEDLESGGVQRPNCRTQLSHHQLAGLQSLMLAPNIGQSDRARYPLAACSAFTRTCDGSLLYNRPPKDAAQPEKPSFLLYLMLARGDPVLPRMPTRTTQRSDI